MQVRVGLVVGPVEWVQVVQVVQMLPDREPPQPPEPLEPTDSVEAAPRISSQSPWHLAALAYYVFNVGRCTKSIGR